MSTKMIAPLHTIPIFQTVHGLTYRIHPVVATEKATNRKESDSKQDAAEDVLTFEQENRSFPPSSERDQ